jgi:hypothetical protein
VKIIKKGEVQKSKYLWKRTITCSKFEVIFEDIFWAKGYGEIFSISYLYPAVRCPVCRRKREIDPYSLPEKLGRALADKRRRCCR